MLLENYKNQALLDLGGQVSPICIVRSFWKS